MSAPLIVSQVPAQTPYIQYVATNGQTVFPYPFEITQDSDLVVVYNGLTLPTDSGYTLSGQGTNTGGNVTFTAGAAAGDIVTLFRDIQIARISQIAQNSGFSSTVFNAEFNNIYLIMQQFEAANQRCLQVPNTNNPAPATTLTPAIYANKFLGFDQYGNPQPRLPPTLAVPASGAILIGQTPAEAAVSVTPVTFTYLPGDPRRYGVSVGSGGDDTAAINNCLLANKLTQFQGQLAYNISAPLIVQNKATVDFLESVINLNDATGLLDHVKVGDGGSTQYNNVTIRNGIFTRSQAATGGYAIKLNYVGDSTINNVLVFGNSRIYGGISITRGIDINVFDSLIESCVGYGINAAGTGVGANETNGLRIDRNLIQSCPVGLNLGDYVEGLFIRNNTFFNCATAGAAYNATNGRVSAKFQQNDFDTCGNGLYLQNLTNITVNENWFSNNSSTGLVIKSSVNSGTINGNQFYSAQSESIEIGGTFLTMAGNFISGGGAGIYVKATATNLLISGNIIANCTAAIDLTENPTGITITGNDLSGNGSFTVKDATVPNARYIANNRALNPVGAVNVPVTASPMTYTSGSSPETLSVYGGTGISVTIGGVTFMSAATQATFKLGPQKAAVIAYSGSPSMTRYIE